MRVPSLPDSRNTRQSAVTATDDMVDGQTVYLQARRFRPLEAYDEKTVVIKDTMTTLDGMALMLCAFYKDRYYPWGSAVLINPGLAITATHVIRDFEDKMGKRLVGVALIALGPSQNGLRLWGIDSIHLQSEGDICLLVIRPKFKVTDAAKFSCPHLSQKTPTLGSLVSGFAFKATGESFGLDESISCEVIMSVGRIIDIYPRRRDNMLSGPCFACSTHFPHGLSGGPVFNQNGDLIAIVSSSADLVPGEKPLAFASFIRWAWERPVKVKATWFPGGDVEFSLASLARANRLFTD